MKKLCLVWLLTMSAIIKPITSIASGVKRSKSDGASVRKSKKSSTKLKALGAAVGVAAVASKAASTHYIINLTGKTIILNFYEKSFITGKSTWKDSKTFGPLLLAGNAATNIVDTLNYQLLPTPIDMHTNTCFKVTVDAFKFNSKKLKDKSIHGTAMPTPATSITPNDFKITLDNNDQLVITELDTCMGIKIPNAEKKQWPSKEELEIRKLSSKDKIKTLEQQNIDIEKDIEKLKEKIKKNKNPLKQNNRKKMIANKKEQIKKNKHTIAKLQEEAAKPAQPEIPVAATPTTQTPSAAAKPAQPETPATATPITQTPSAATKPTQPEIPAAAKPTTQTPPANAKPAQPETFAVATPTTQTPPTLPVMKTSPMKKTIPSSDETDKTHETDEANEADETDFKNITNFDEYANFQEDTDLEDIKSYDDDDNDDDDDENAA